jgi:hypothetical protein
VAVAGDADGLRGRLTWVVDFVATTNPSYRAWRTALPDLMNPSSRTWFLYALWAAIAAAPPAYAAQRPPLHGRGGEQRAARQPPFAY